ncbi:hypothetical protein Dda_1136 [Drechslerella dactyloides]|uniref:Uncharacterized protein n=1 Tax=Drechslerella dactyloides TaxID=74499 RepID=A0AAD6NNN7_DREDA|nr:hypothetical protein Dda_1136 [Drechslerella dactyloides]
MTQPCIEAAEAVKSNPDMESPMLPGTREIAIIPTRRVFNPGLADIATLAIQISTSLSPPLTAYKLGTQLQHLLLYNVKTTTDTLVSRLKKHRNFYGTEESELQPSGSLKGFGWLKRYTKHSRAKKSLERSVDLLECYVTAISIATNFERARLRMQDTGDLGDRLPVIMAGDISTLKRQIETLERIPENRRLISLISAYQSNADDCLRKYSEPKKHKGPSRRFETAAIEPKRSDRVPASVTITQENSAKGAPFRSRKTGNESNANAKSHNEAKPTTKNETSRIKRVGIAGEDILLRDPEITNLPDISDNDDQPEGSRIPTSLKARKNVPNKPKDEILKIFVTGGDSNYDRKTGFRINTKETLNVFLGRIMSSPVEVELQKSDGSKGPGPDMLSARGHVVGLNVRFHRTLRLPEDDGRTHHLPPGLGTIPLYSVERYKELLPKDIVDKGGALLPLYNREAFWISFSIPKWLLEYENYRENPSWAARIYLGGVNGISGEPMVPNMGTILKKQNEIQKTQDYIVVPPQKWLDGIATAPGIVRQFVGVTRNSGYSVEQQVTGFDNVGGLQLELIPRSDYGGDRYDTDYLTAYTGNSEEKRLDISKSADELGLEEGSKIFVKDTSEYKYKEEKLRSAGTQNHENANQKPKQQNPEISLRSSDDSGTPFKVITDGGRHIEINMGGKCANYMSSKDGVEHNDLVDFLVKETGLNPIGRKLFVGNEPVPASGTWMSARNLGGVELYWACMPRIREGGSLQISFITAVGSSYRLTSPQPGTTWGRALSDAGLRGTSNALTITVNESDSVDSLIRRVSLPGLDPPLLFVPEFPFFSEDEPYNPNFLSIRYMPLKYYGLRSEYYSDGPATVYAITALRGGGGGGTPEEISLSVGAGAKIKQTVMEDRVPHSEWMASKTKSKPQNLGGTEKMLKRFRAKKGVVGGQPMSYYDHAITPFASLASLAEIRITP